MEQPFDIFRREVDGRFVWCGAAQTLAEVHAMIKRLDDHVSEFVVVDEESGERQIIKPQSPLTQSA